MKLPVKTTLAHDQHRRNRQFETQEAARSRTIQQNREARVFTQRKQDPEVAAMPQLAQVQTENRNHQATEDPSQEARRLRKDRRVQ